MDDRTYDIFKLPSGLEILVVEFMDTRDMANCAQVSRLWHYCLLQHPKIEYWAHIAEDPRFVSFKQPHMSNLEVAKAFYESIARNRVLARKGARRKRMESIQRNATMVALALAALAALFVLYYLRNFWCCDALLKELAYWIGFVVIPLYFTDHVWFAEQYSMFMIFSNIIRFVVVWANALHVIFQCITACALIWGLAFSAILSFIENDHNGRLISLLALFVYIVVRIIILLLYRSDLGSYGYDQWIFRLSNLAFTVSLFIHILLFLNYYVDQRFYFNLHDGSYAYHPWTRHYMTLIILSYTGSLFTSVALTSQRLSTDQSLYWIWSSLVVPVYLIAFTRLHHKWKALLLALQILILINFMIVTRFLMWFCRTLFMHFCLRVTSLLYLISLRPERLFRFRLNGVFAEPSS